DIGIANPDNIVTVERHRRTFLVTDAGYRQPTAPVTHHEQQTHNSNALPHFGEVRSRTPGQRIRDFLSRPVVHTAPYSGHNPHDRTMSPQQYGATTKVRHCPSARELDDLELLCHGAFAPLWGFEPEGGTVTLRVP